MSNKYITLKNLAKISGFASDYIGFLIRKRKILGKKLYSGKEWKVSKKSLLNYIDRKKIKTTLRGKWILRDKYLSLKEAARISGYAPDYVGYLIRKEKVRGKKIFFGISWITTKAEIEKYRLLKNKYRKTKYFIPSLTFGRSFYFSLRIPRYVFVFTILGLFIFGGLVTFAFTSKKPILTTEIYPLQIQGDPEKISSEFNGADPEGEQVPYGAGWKNLQNVQGPPEVGPNGDFNSFSELNSAVYQSGSSNLISSDFKATEVDLEITKIKEATTTATSTEAISTATTTEELISKEATSTLETTSTLIIEATSTPEITSTTESTTTEATTTEITTTEATSTPESTSTPEELPKTENQTNKTSTEESLIEQTQNETSNENEQSESEPEINSEPETTPVENPETPTSFFQKVKNFFEKRIVRAQETPTFEELVNKNELLSVKIKFSFAIGEKKNDLQLNPEINSEGTTTPIFEPASFWQKFRNFFSNLSHRIVEIFNNFVKREKPIPIAEASDDNLGTPDLLLNNTEPIIVENTTTESTITETETNESTTPTTIEETLPGLDDKIIIWWSTDGKNWQKLDTISSNSLSNALNPVRDKSLNGVNGGYFSYEAPFLKNWEEIKNLKIKFEGAVGGETNLITYLDSVWLEVEYQEKEEEEEFELIAIKRDWRADEEPEFEVVKKGERKENIVEKLGGVISSVFEEEPRVEASLIKPQNNEILLEEGKSFSAETHSPTRIKIFKPRDFRPGLHKIKIEYEKNGKIYNFEQEFTWGVLAINFNKSIYTLADEQAYLQFGVLDDEGHTICDASLKLRITNPKLQTVILSTEDGTIHYSGECGANNVTNVPDYFAYYQLPGEIGVYELELTAHTKNGTRTITDSFEVRESVPFDVERVGPTRIYPPATYEMRMIVKVNQDFVGEVIESVPESFEIKSQILDFNFQILNSKIIWQVDWQLGEIYELSYQFKAPDISPEFYLLGPLQFYKYEYE